MTYAKFIGIDVAKDKLDVVALMTDKKPLHKVFKNNQTGFKALLEWLKKHTEEPCVCMEATGHYSEAAAEFLYEHDVFVSVINPYQIKQFARMKLARNKNDKADATLIAEYAQQTTLTAFKPRTKEQKKLRDLMLLQHTLKEQKTQLSNKAESMHSIETRNEIKKILKRLTKQIDALQTKMTEFIQSDEQFKKIADRLTQIMGFGEISAYKILAYLPDIAQFESAKSLAAYVGVSPRQYESGKLKARTRMSKVGCIGLRNALYMPALCAKRHNEHLQPFVKRLEASGLKPKAIVGALMRKLVHIIYGMLKHDQPFNPALACKA